MQHIFPIYDDSGPGDQKKNVGFVFKPCFSTLIYRLWLEQCLFYHQCLLEAVNYPSK